MNYLKYKLKTNKFLNQHVLGVVATFVFLAFGAGLLFSMPVGGRHMLWCFVVLIVSSLMIGVIADQGE